jgi:hypothetical protein
VNFNPAKFEVIGPEVPTTLAFDISSAAGIGDRLKGTQLNMNGLPFRGRIRGRLSKGAPISLITDKILALPIKPELHLCNLYFHETAQNSLAWLMPVRLRRKCI